MPIHDWNRVPAGIYRDFHRGWTVEIRRALNRGLLPAGYYAMVERRTGRPGPETIASQLGRPEPTGGLVVTETPPCMKKVSQVETEKAFYARRADRIAIRNKLGRAVAIIEVISPGNKANRRAIASFVDEAVDFLRDGIHLVVIDPFPPGPRDPRGIAQAIWDGLIGEPLATRTEDNPLTVAAFDAGDPLTAYVETLAVGDPWLEAPLFLAPGWYVNVPLEETYQASWDMTPPIRGLVEPSAAAELPEA
jgi:hypothetical protein